MNLIKKTKTALWILRTRGLKVVVHTIYAKSNRSVRPNLMVLKGFPRQTASHPKVILCEFENVKTEPLGYDFHDLADYLTNLGYQLIISEWYPVKACG